MFNCQNCQMIGCLHLKCGTLYIAYIIWKMPSTFSYLYLYLKRPIGNKYSWKWLLKFLQRIFCMYLQFQKLILRCEIYGVFITKKIFHQIIEIAPIFFTFLNCTFHIIKRILYDMIRKIRISMIAVLLETYWKKIFQN